VSLLKRVFGRGARVDGDGDEIVVDEPRPIRLVFALGNPGPDYAGNRRNVGFWVVNRLAKKHGIEFKTKTGTYALAEGEISGRPVAIAKTRTFNNDSGKAVWALVKTLKIDEPGEILIVSDHLDLPSGRVRIRRKGGGGGQKGMSDIIRVLKSEEFPRLRLGIGRPVVRGEPSWEPDHVAAWVLSDPPPDEKALLEAAVERAVDAIESALADGVEVAMNVFNRDETPGKAADTA
jgi:PTH1 family peptidyl-tRNA hydrolase